MVITLEPGANDLHMVYRCHPIMSCFIKIQNGFTFQEWRTQVVLKKRPLNGCLFCLLVFLYL